MGSEQSCNKPRNREPAATPRDVEKALEQQTKMYEQRMKQLLEESNLTGTTTTAPRVDPLNSLRVPASHQQQTASNEQELTAASPRDVEKVMEQQTKMYEQKMKQLLEESKCSAATSTAPRVDPLNSPRATASHQQHTASNELSRSRSQSRERSENNDANCVTCGKMYGEKIYQCQQGHSSCDMCKTRQVLCGQCSLQLTDLRNFNLEIYLMERKVKCPNSMEGCNWLIKIAEMEIHEKECLFKALQCPSLGSGCTWTGKLSQLPNHFNEMHPLHKHGKMDKEMFMTDINNASHVMHYIRIGTFNFLFHIKVSQADARIYVAAQLIGSTAKSAAKWYFVIHIYNKSEPSRKYQCTERCSSASEPLQKIINSSKCAVIPQDYAKTFICGGTIAYKFYIKKEEVKVKESATSNSKIRQNIPKKKFVNKQL